MNKNIIKHDGKIYVSSSGHMTKGLVEYEWDFGWHSGGIDVNFYDFEEIKVEVGDEWTLLDRKLDEVFANSNIKFNTVKIKDYV